MTSRYFLSLGLAFAAVVSAPLAFAQDANAGATGQENAAAQPATPATPADPQAGTSAVPATPAQPAATAGKVTWSDLDADKDGKLTRTEAAPIDSLSQSFEAADADKDGALTTDEYKAYLAANGKVATGSGG